MTYLDYRALREGERIAERGLLLKANLLRAATGMDEYNVEEELNKRLPLMSEDEWNEQMAFHSYYAEMVKNLLTRAELLLVYENDAKKVATILQIRDAKIRQAWAGKTFSN